MEGEIEITLIMPLYTREDRGQFRKAQRRDFRHSRGLVSFARNMTRLERGILLIG
jgi:hypothetical protein